MIGKLTGRLAGEMGDGSVLMEVGGVGYVVRIAPASAILLLDKRGEDIELFIHTAVREDAIDLYGFPTMAELSFFKLLVGVSGVGPKTALGILAVADVPSLSRAVAAGDATMLTKVYGVGKKSAERIVVELKDKLAKQQEKMGSPISAPSIAADTDVLEALENLGYTLNESREALRHVPPSAEGVRARLAAALKHLGTPASRV